MAKVLIVDDEAAILNLMSKACKQSGHDVTTVDSEADARKTLDKISDFDVLVVDLVLGDGSGMDVVKYADDKCPESKVIMVTGHGTIETAVEAMRLGAFDYLTKPFELADLRRAVDLAYQAKVNPTVETDSTLPSFDLGWTPGELIGSSDKMTAIGELAKKIASNDSPVLLEGETGTGKQMVARTIHNASDRNDAPFKVLQCSALPEELLEAELFGSGSRGETIFARAMGGTVLIEEIHMLPLRLQSMLESHLEEVSARRLSGNISTKMDARFIASSAKKLEECVEAGTFREDLYYKISVIPVDVPPLRNRKEDIALLADYFLQRYAERTNSSQMEVDKYATRLLENYSWPGNVGELQNAIERACAFAEDGRIRPVDLPPKVAQKVEITDEDEKTTHHLPIGTPLSDYIKKQEKIFIRETLKYNEGSREKTASMLDVSIATLYRKMGLKLEREKILNSSS